MDVLNSFSRTSFPCVSLKDDDDVYLESEPLRILVPSEFIGSIIGWKGSHIKDMAVSSRTKIHIDTSLLEFPGEAVVKVYGSAIGCAEVAKKVSRILFKRPCNVICSLKVVFPSRYVGHLIGKNGQYIKQVEKNAEVKIDLLNLLINFTSVFKINGSLLSVEEAVFLLTERVQDLFHCEIETSEPSSYQLGVDTSKQTSYPCEFMFSIPYESSLSNTADETVMKLKRFCVKTATSIEQKGLVKVSLNSLQQTLVKFKVQGKFKDVIEVQLYMLQCVLSHKDEVFCCEFKVSNRTYNIFQANRSSKAKLCEVMKFHDLNCTAFKSVELAGKFFNVHLTFKSLMKTELFPVKMEKEIV